MRTAKEIKNNIKNMELTMLTQDIETYKKFKELIAAKLKETNLLKGNYYSLNNASIKDLIRYEQIVADSFNKALWF